jgi:hypothetical protein
MTAPRRVATNQRPGGFDVRAVLCTRRPCVHESDSWTRMAARCPSIRGLCGSYPTTLSTMWTPCCPVCRPSRAPSRVTSWTCAKRLGLFFSPRVTETEAKLSERVRELRASRRMAKEYAELLGRSHEVLRRSLELIRTIRALGSSFQGRDRRSAGEDRRSGRRIAPSVDKLPPAEETRRLTPPPARGSEYLATTLARGQARARTSKAASRPRTRLRFTRCHASLLTRSRVRVSRGWTATTRTKAENYDFGSQHDGHPIDARGTYGSGRLGSLLSTERRDEWVAMIAVIQTSRVAGTPSAMCPGLLSPRYMLEGLWKRRNTSMVLQSRTLHIVTCSSAFISCDTNSADLCRVVDFIDRDIPATRGKP